MENEGFRSDRGTDAPSEGRASSSLLGKGVHTCLLLGRFSVREHAASSGKTGIL